MNKNLFTLVSVTFWLLIGAAVLLNIGVINEHFSQGEDDTQLVAAYVVIAVLFLGGILVNTMLADRVIPKSLLEGGTESMSAEEKRQIAEKQSASLLKEGKVREAILTLEAGGLMERALSLAQERNEHLIAARLLLGAGRKDQARKAAAKGGDHLMAANVSMLLRDFGNAKTEYLEHLQKKGAGWLPLERARFLDRGGKYAEAAAIYTECGDYARAMDAWYLAGDAGRAVAAREKLDVLVALEKGKSSNPGVATRLTRDAEAATVIGDLIAAGWYHRDAGSHKRAAELFESIDEWIRAAICWELVGDMEKARRLWEKAGGQKAAQPPQNQNPPTQVPQPSAPQSQGPSSFPSSPGVRGPQFTTMAPPAHFPVPSSLPPPAPFQPLTEQQSLVAVVLPPSLLQSARLKAPPRDAAGWRDLAQALAMNGNLQGAAQVHFQQGDIPQAVDCLKDAGRGMEAAQLALGVGDYGRAVELLVDQIEATNVAEVGGMLGQILVNLGEFELADQLLRKRLAPRFDERTAPLVFRFARMLEDAGALVQASCLYEDLLKSGATSAELEACLRSVQRRLKNGDPGASHTGTGTSGLLTSQIRRKLNAWDFIEAAIADSDDMIKKPADVEPTVQAPAQPAKPYVFTPAKPQPPATPEPAAAEIPPSLRAARNVSLMGGATEQETRAEERDLFNITERYRIDKELGKGGMGAVYKAHDLMLDRPVALKLLHSFGSNPSALRQFLLEARAIARMNHPHVIRVYDIGVMNLQHYIAMEMVTGCDLRQHIVKEKQLQIREAMRLFVQIAEGLGAAHEAGIVHRDIKPANVLLTDGLDARIVDFGLAKIQGPAVGNDDNSVFRTAGTPGFMAPEQIRGESAGPAADIYALGITLFQMLVGQPPHRLLQIQGPENILAFTMKAELPSIRAHRPEVPAAIDQLYRFCTAYAIEDRFQEVKAFIPGARQWMEAL